MRTSKTVHPCPACHMGERPLDDGETPGDSWLVGFTVAHVSDDAMRLEIMNRLCHDHKMAMTEFMVTMAVEDAQGGMSDG